MHFFLYCTVISTNINNVRYNCIISNPLCSPYTICLSVTSQTMMNTGHDEFDRGNESLLIKMLFVHSTFRKEQVVFFLPVYFLEAWLRLKAIEQGSMQVSGNRG